MTFQAGASAACPSANGHDIEQVPSTTRPVVLVRRWAWAVVLLAGLGAVAGYHRLGSVVAQDVALVALQLVAVGAILAGSRLHHQRLGADWRLWTVALLVGAAGSGVYLWYEGVLGVLAPFPSPADPLFLISQLLLAAGLYAHLRHSRAQLLDAGAVAVMGGLAFWLFLGEVFYHDAVLTGAQQAVLLARPVATLVVLALAVELWLRCRRSTSSLLLGLAVASLVITETAYTVALAGGWYQTGGPLDSGWHLSWVLWAAAGLHPAAMASRAPGSWAASSLSDWRRAALLAGAALLVPVLAGISLWSSDREVAVAFGLVGVALSGVVFARLLAALRSSEQAATRLRASEERTQDLAAQYREILERYDLALEHGGHLVWEWDVRTGDTPIYAASKSLEWLRPGTLEDFKAVVHPDDWDRIQTEIVAALAGEREYDVEFRLLPPDGDVLWFRTVAKVVRDETGQPLRVVGLGKDITREHRAEEQLHATEEQLHHSQKMEALGRLAGGVAHDINNVLTVVLGHLDFLEADAGEHHSRQDVAGIRCAAERAAGLVEQLLTFSTGSYLSGDRTDLNASMEATTSLLTQLIGEDVELSILAEAEHATVPVAASRLEQILLNLVVNARDAMPRGGELTIRTRNVTVVENQGSSVPAGDYVELSVADTGVGIPEDVQNHIFDPFFTTKGDGSGLGLTTVYGVVGQAGGHIDVETGLGTGTTFRIHLPCVVAAVEPAVEAAPAVEPAPAARPSSASETVLVVEDAEAVRNLMVRGLEGRGYEVRTAASQKLLRGGAVDLESVELLIADVVMPQVSGPALVSALRAHRPELKVLYVSGYSDQRIDLDPHRDAFLAKPFDPEALCRRVRELLDRPAQPVRAGR